jgi:AcrR family transcriptional regulator
MPRQKRPDSRVLKTKAAIRDAYLRLLEQKDADLITVTDVALAADVDRKTIYNYYIGSDAILDELENELVSSISTSIREKDLVRFIRDPFGFLDAITRAFDSQPDLSYPLIRQSGATMVFAKLADRFSAQLAPVLKGQLRPQKQPYAKLYADFLSNGIVSVYRDWIINGMQQPLEEISRQLRILTEGLFTTSMKRKVLL